MTTLRKVMQSDEVKPLFISTIQGLMPTSPGTKSGESRASFGLNKNARLLKRKGLTWKGKPLANSNA